MITERDLLQAIRECEAEPITAQKVSKLADLYIIYDHLFGEPMVAGYSYESKTANHIIETSGGTEFLEFVNGKETEKVMSVMDELMEAVKTLHPRMYDGVLRKIENA